MMSRAGNPGILVALLVGLAVALVRWPALGAVLATALLYLNLLPIAIRSHGVPPVVVAGAAALLVPDLIRTFVVQRGRLIVNRPFLIMLVFLACALISSFYARVREYSYVWIARYLGEGILLYLLFINVIRGKALLRRIVWLLVICGAFLASLTVYQEFAGYSNEFGGLAGRYREESGRNASADGHERADRERVRDVNRAMGPIDDPNRYAQILLVLLPLGWCLIKSESRPQLRLAAGACSALSLGGILLTYSRGAFVALIGMVMVMAVLRLVSARQLIMVALAGALSMAVLSPGYGARMTSLLGIGGLFGGPAKSDVAPDDVERGRATHMLAAWNVFLDHPVFGVGPGQFAKVYSVDYSSELYSLRRVTKAMRAHSLYLELIAETGVVGFTVFMAVVVAAAWRLLLARRRAVAADPFLGSLAAAILVAIAGYLVSAVFLQLSYQRYYWFLLALGAATVHLIESHSSEEHPPVSASPVGHA
jgi:O-antigen ligase/polysaccharide polymerase Wzy-like membrane protein